LPCWYWLATNYQYLPLKWWPIVSSHMVGSLKFEQFEFERKIVHPFRPFFMQHQH